MLHPTHFVSISLPSVDAVQSPVVGFSCYMDSSGAVVRIALTGVHTAEMVIPISHPPVDADSLLRANDVRLADSNGARPRYRRSN